MKPLVLLAASLCIGAPVATAATVVSTFGSFDGPTQLSGFPLDLGVVGTFHYSLPAGATITSATFSGTHGTAFVPTSTAGYIAFLALQIIEVCAPYAADCWITGDAFRPFSFDLDPSAFATLAAGGGIDLRVIQTSEFNVRLGSPTLTINYEQPVPEPGSLALSAIGLLAALAGARRRRRRRS